MGYLLKIFYVFTTVIIVNYVFNILFRFLDVPTNVYGPYLMWIIALFIFYALIPVKKSIF